MVRLTAPVDAAWSRANARAAEHAKAGLRPKRNGANEYLVPSATEPGRWYTVRIHHVGHLDASCDCPHGQHPSGRSHCWHAAASLAAEIARVSRPPASRCEAFERAFARS